jgi:hypothetical protein
MGRNKTAPPHVLSPSSILLPSTSDCDFIPVGKNWVRVSKMLVHFFGGGGGEGDFLSLKIRKLQWRQLASVYFWLNTVSAQDRNWSAKFAVGQSEGDSYIRTVFPFTKPGLLLKTLRFRRNGAYYSNAVRAVVFKLCFAKLSGSASAPLL